jgi:hypothetical protein
MSHPPAQLPLPDHADRQNQRWYPSDTAAWMQIDAALKALATGDRQSWVTCLDLAAKIAAHALPIPPYVSETTPFDDVEIPPDAL